MMKRCPVCSTDYPETQRSCPTHGVLLVESREFAPGTIFRDTYRIERVLGRGGTGIVYLAEHLLLNEARALKFLNAELASNPGAVQRFLREARAASKIHHPNIVKTLDLGQGEDGSFFLCMEYVDGPSLAALIDAAPQGLPPERAFAIARGIAQGLDAAHARQLVHRDIKPGNILLGQTMEGDEIPKIADFGIVTGTAAEGRLTRTGLQPLTPEYASPEQWRGVIPGHELDGRTDLYALGCVFFEMLTGSVPFHGHSSDDLREQHVNAAAPVPSLVRPELAKFAGLDALVMRLMNKSREHRPASAKSFLDELDGLSLRDNPIETTNALVSIQNESAVENNLHREATSRHELPERTSIYWIGKLIGLLVGLFLWPFKLVQLPYFAGKKASDWIFARFSKNSGLTTSQTLTKPKSGKRNLLMSLILICVLLPVIVIAISTEGRPLEVYHAWQLSKSCDVGDGHSCYYLGEEYESGQAGVHFTYDQSIASELYSRACERNVAAACTSLGYLYQRGFWGRPDVYPNLHRAQTLYNKACRLGDSLGCYRNKSVGYD